MDIDAARVPKDPKKAAEEAHCRKEGLCYKCKEKGHIINKCPKWPTDHKGKPPPYQPKARATTTPTVIEEGPPIENANNLKDLARTIHTLNDQKTEELFKLIMDNEDF